MFLMPTHQGLQLLIQRGSKLESRANVLLVVSDERLQDQADSLHRETLQQDGPLLP